VRRDFAAPFLFLAIDPAQPVLEIVRLNFNVDNVNIQ
jgi:hypothetical protein|tara:strand:- start:376 stop:486 length:111 start_codon:yes stop_codon:yes gene_type:complete